MSGCYAGSAQWAVGAADGGARALWSKRVWGIRLSGSSEQVVVYDSASEHPGGVGTTVSVLLRRWPDPRPALVIEDHYCSGRGNPYWDSDDLTSQLELSPGATVALAAALGVDAPGLPSAVAALVAGDGSHAIDRVQRLCDEHGVGYVKRAGSAWEELAGEMQASAARGATDENGTEFALPGPARDALVAALREDQRSSSEGLATAACRLATVAHEGQVDKAGKPYIGHPGRVADAVGRAGGAVEAVAAAWLHDVVEDTWVTAEFLVQAGFPAAVVSAVEAVTKRPDEATDAYAGRIAADPIAVQVKRADLTDNTDPIRLARLDRRTRSRLEAKYTRFVSLLDAALEGSQ